MIRFSYDLLGLQSFFTVGPDEVRAWTVRRGAMAPEAAGRDPLRPGERFHIRAEVVTYDDLVELGGLERSQRQGQTAPGRQDLSVVQDGDILNIRFNL